MTRLLRLIALLLLLTVFLWFAPAQTSGADVGTLTATEHGSTAQPFDIKAAVDAYLAKMPAAQRAHSDAYFEGGYWLLLWDFLSTGFVMWLLLHFRWSGRMRNLAARITR